MLNQKLRLKGCPRCAGDLMPDRSDNTGNSYACLQCGREFSAAMIAGNAAAAVAAQPAVPSFVSVLPAA